MFKRSARYASRERAFTLGGDFTGLPAMVKAKPPSNRNCTVDRSEAPGAGSFTILLRSTAITEREAFVRMRYQMLEICRSSRFMPARRTWRRYVAIVMRPPHRPDPTRIATTATLKSRLRPSLRFRGRRIRRLRVLQTLYRGERRHVHSRRKCCGSQDTELLHDTERDSSRLAIENACLNHL